MTSVPGSLRDSLAEVFWWHVPWKVGRHQIYDSPCQTSAYNGGITENLMKTTQVLRARITICSVFVIGNCFENMHGDEDWVSSDGRISSMEFVNEGDKVRMSRRGNNAESSLWRCWDTKEKTVVAWQVTIDETFIIKLMEQTILN